MIGIETKNKQINDGYYHRNTCRICGGIHVEKFLSLGPIPLANNLLEEDEVSNKEIYYPLDVFFCKDCHLVQLLDVVSPDLMFKNYVYMTGASEPMQKHFSSLVEDSCRYINRGKKGYVVDIGSNDGTLLQIFSRHGFATLGVEPATNLVKISESKGIRAINAFFNTDTAHKVYQRHGAADVITATNVFAHVDNLQDVLNGVNHLLSSEGIFIIEVPYLFHLINRLEFDTIYHEHLSYFSLESLLFLFEKYGMTVVDVKQVSTHGGSIRVFIKKGGKSSKNVLSLLKFENDEKINDFATYIKFGNDVSKLRQELIDLLKNLKKSGYRITGYGATAKGNTLLNYCNIGIEYLDYISDTTPLKQGKYTPGMHVPIVSEEQFHKNPPNYAILLAWNYADEILQKETTYRKKGGKFILPIPRPTVI